MSSTRLTFLLILLFGAASAKAASVLDIGTDYRLRGITNNRPGYGAPGDDSHAYYSQRLLAHVGGGDFLLIWNS